MNKISLVAIIVGVAVAIGAISVLLLNNDMVILTGGKNKDGYTDISNSPVTTQSSGTVKHYAINLSDSAASTSHT